MTPLSFPNARLTIEDALEAFADAPAQRRFWIEKEHDRSGVFPTFQDAIHWLFDDSGLGDGADACVGATLYNNDEARILNEAMNSIDALLEKYGPNVSGATYVNSPEWPAIVARANVCLSVFRHNDIVNSVLSPRE